MYAMSIFLKHRFYAGYVCLATWTGLLYSSSVLVLSAGALPPLSIAHLFSTVGAIVGGLLVALVASRFSPLAHRRESLHFFGIVGAIGSSGIALVSAGTASSEWACVCLLLCGISGSWIMVAWMEQFASQEAKRAFVAYALISLVAQLISLLITTLPYVVGIPITVLLPIAATFSLRPVTDDNVEVRKPAEMRKPAPKWPSLDYRALLANTPLRFMIVMGIVSFSMGALKTMQLPNDPALTPLLTWVIGFASSLAGMGIACAFASLSFKHNFSIAYYFAIPIIALSSLLLVLPVELPGTLLSSIGSVGNSLVGFLTWMILIQVVYEGRIPAAWGFGLLTAMQFTGTLLGQAVTVLSGSTNLIVAFAVLIVLLVASLAAINIRPGGKPGFASKTGTEDVDAGYLEQRGRSLANRCGLSPREEEILLIWITGHNSAYIEARLFISKNTVKTHLTHIYAKTKTANREGLLMLLEQEAAVGPDTPANAVEPGRRD